MAHFKVGDKSKAICDWCKKVVQTTFKLCDYKVSGKPTIPNVLQGVCEECGRAISILGHEINRLTEERKIP